MPSTAWGTSASCLGLSGRGGVKGGRGRGRAENAKLIERASQSCEKLLSGASSLSRPSWGHIAYAKIFHFSFFLFAHATKCVFVSVCVC